MFAASRPRRRSRVSFAAVVIGTALLLAGCGNPGEVKKYNADTKENFMSACVEANSGLSDDRAVDACGCWYDAVSGPDGLSFDDFKKAEANIRLALDENRLNNGDDLKSAAPDYYALITSSDCLASGPRVG